MNARGVLIFLFVCTFFIPSIEASIAGDCSPQTLLAQTDSIVIGEIVSSEFDGHGFRIVVRIDSYLNNKPTKIYIISSGEHRFKPEVEDVVILLLSHEGDDYRIVKEGIGMYKINEANLPPEINVLLQNNFIKYVPNNPLTVFSSIISTIKITGLALLLKKRKL